MQPTYRKPLNDKQQDILALLARFRFATAPLISSYLGTTTRRYIHERLRILTEQEYIGKRYDNSYRLAGRSAEYFLLPKGIEALAENENYSKKFLKLLAKDVNASDRFVRHCLNILSAAVQLKGVHGDKLQFRTRSDYAGNELFPQSLPDGYVFMQNGNNRTHYFVECFDGTMPESVMRAAISKHIEFYDNDNWTTDAAYPTVLLMCRDERLKAKVEKWVQKAQAEAWSDDVRFELLLPL